MMVVDPYRFAGGTATLTIPSDNIRASLTGFPVMVRLSDLPSGFWNNVKADGGDIRATDAVGVIIPHDLSRFDYASNDGVLWVRLDLDIATDVSFNITCGDSALSQLAVADSNGRNAVWADFESVFLLGESAVDRTGGGVLEITLDPEFFEETATSPDINCHEGIDQDGAYYYGFDSNAIRKYDLSWSLVSTNSDPAGDTGISGVTDCGGGCVANGLIYLVVGDAGGTQNHIAVFNTSDLSYVESFNITTNGLTAADLCYRADTGLLYTIRYNNGDTIRSFNPSDGSYQSAITLSQTLPTPQGITFWRGAFWVNSDDAGADEVYRVETDGSVTNSGLFGPAAKPTTMEGMAVSVDGEGILLLDDTGTPELVRTFKPYDFAGGGGARFATQDEYCEADWLGSVTSFTMGVSIAPDDTTTDHALTYRASSSPVTNRLVTLGHGASGVFCWDSAGNGFLYSGVSAPTDGSATRCHVTYDSNYERKVYVSGVMATSDAGIAVLPTDLDILTIGRDDENSANYWRGKIGFAYLRSGVLPPEWLAAEQANLSSPSTFYVVGTPSYTFTDRETSTPTTRQTSAAATRQTKARTG